MAQETYRARRRRSLHISYRDGRWLNPLYNGYDQTSKPGRIHELD